MFLNLQMNFNLTHSKAFRIHNKTKPNQTKPNIDIQIVEYGSLRVAVLGEVNKPGIIFLRGKTTIYSIYLTQRYDAGIFEIFE